MMSPMIIKNDFRDNFQASKHVYRKECVTKISCPISQPKISCIFSHQTYVLGTQKNCLNETVLLSTLNKCLK